MTFEEIRGRELTPAEHERSAIDAIRKRDAQTGEPLAMPTPEFAAENDEAMRMLLAEVRKMSEEERIAFNSAIETLKKADSDEEFQRQAALVKKLHAGAGYLGAIALLLSGYDVGSVVVGGLTANVATRMPLGEKAIGSIAEAIPTPSRLEFIAREKAFTKLRTAQSDR